jgi:hypothetical protein
VYVLRSVVIVSAPQFSVLEKSLSLDFSSTESGQVHRDLFSGRWVQECLDSRPYLYFCKVEGKQGHKFCHQTNINLHIVRLYKTLAVAQF